MTKHLLFSAYFLGSIGLVGCLSGCDQINALTEKLFSKDKTPSAVATPSSANSSSSQDKKTISADQKGNEKLSSSSNLAAGVLAQVGNWTITKEEFNERLRNLKEVVPDFDLKKEDNRKLVLDELVRQQLMVFDAEEKGVGKKKEIEEAITEFRKTMLVRESVNNLTANINVTDVDVQNYYDQNKQLFVDPAEYRLREIVVFTQSGAKEILVEVLKGADFAQIAKDKSKAKTASVGGDMGFKKAQDLSSQLTAAIANLEPGDVSTVFKAEGGFSIVKLEEKKGGKPLNFSDVKADIKTGLTQLKQQQVVLDYLGQLEKKYPVKVNESLLKD